MAIAVEKEPDEIYTLLNPRIVEKCVFCRTGTRYWHLETNNPVCQPCSIKHDPGELRNWLLGKAGAE